MRSAAIGVLPLVLCVAPAAQLDATQLFVRGTASSVYYVKRMPAWLSIGSYQVSGYTLERGLPDWEGRVRFKVTASADLMQSRAVFEPKRELIPSIVQDYILAGPNVPAGSKPFKKLAEEQVRRCEYQSEAVESILSYIGETITYDENSRDEDPAVVLEKRRGYCVGIANLGLTLLRSVGIPSRAAQGLILTPDGMVGSETRMDFQLHRLIEVYYPDLGWVLSDPQRTVNFVSPAWIYWKAVETGTPQTRLDLEGMQIFRVKEEGVLKEEDARTSEGPGRIFLRKNFDLRYSAAIDVSVLSPDGRPVVSGQVTLQSSAGVVRQAVRADGSATFVGLRGGEYTLRYDESGVSAAFEKIKVKDREYRTLTLTAAKAAGVRR